MTEGVANQEGQKKGGHLSIASQKQALAKLWERSSRRRRREGGEEEEEKKGKPGLEALRRPNISQKAGGETSLNSPFLSPHPKKAIQSKKKALLLNWRSVHCQRGSGTFVVHHWLMWRSVAGARGAAALQAMGPHGMEMPCEEAERHERNKTGSWES